MNTLEEFCTLVLETEQMEKGERSPSPPSSSSVRDPPPPETHEPEEEEVHHQGSEPSMMFLDSTLMEVPTAIPLTTSEALLSLPYKTIMEMEERDEDTHRLPSLCTSDSESSLDSIEDLSEVSSTTNSSNSRRLRRLTFHPNVQVREYASTVSDHPCCTDSLPISLDWSHANDYYMDIAHSRDRGLHYVPPPRLTVKQRFSRLAECSVDLTKDELDALIGSNRERSSYLRQGQRMIVGLFSALALSLEVAEEYEQDEAVCSFEEWDAAAPTMVDAEPFCI